MDTTRIDRWVWSVRAYKTRSDATEACRGGHVKVNGVTVKPAATVRIGDRVTIRGRGAKRDLEITEVIDKRVGAPAAAKCYVDLTPPVLERDRVRVAERERGAGRPTKRDRRVMDRWRST